MYRSVLPFNSRTQLKHNHVLIKKHKQYGILNAKEKKPVRTPMTKPPLYIGKFYLQPNSNANYENEQENRVEMDYLKIK